MEEKKLTDEEIVKALENCIQEIDKMNRHSCDFCPYREVEPCGKAQMTDCLDLIKRLQDENETLKTKKFGMWKVKFFKLKEEFDKELAEHEEFVEKINAEIERLTEERDGARTAIEQYSRIYRNNLDCLFKEKAELQKQVDELKELAKINLKNERNWGKIQTKQAVEDTAKEILLWLIEHTHESDYIEKYFKERYGVEVE